MIQRIQTIYLLLAVLTLGFSVFYPVWTDVNSPGAFPINIFEANPYLPLRILWIVMPVIPLVAIFFYKKRKRQITLCRISFLIVVFFLAFVCFYLSQGNINSYFTLLPAVSLLFLYLAYRNIRKDEELVRSMDRLR